MHCRATGIECSVDDCAGPPFASGMCSTHYGRWQRRGDTTDPIAPSQEERFLAHVERGSSSECWVWTGPTFKGYGSFSIQRAPGQQTTIGAHRWAYNHWVSPIPEGFIVCHRCDNPPCVNPAHLFVGTHRDNAIDRERKGRGAALRGSQRSQAVLTEEIVMQIWALYVPGRYAAKRIAQQLGLKQGTVQGVLSGYTWAHLAPSSRLKAS